MNLNSKVITALCSKMCIGDNVFPLEPREWSNLASELMQKGIAPEALLTMASEDLRSLGDNSIEFAERISRLINRIPSLEFEISKYENMGISIVTRADTDYPEKLKKKLGNSCPPLFYCSGDMSILRNPSIGFVGSRSISADDEIFTRETARKTVEKGFAVVSGGAKGVDSTASDEATAAGGKAIEYLADSLLSRLKKMRVIDDVQNGNRVLLSVAKPDAGFNAGMAMMRNRYIYSQAEGVVIVKSDYNKGGTWAGATENFKFNWCPEFCREVADYKGNMALINMGAFPIDNSWDGNLDVQQKEPEQQKNEYEQISLFD